MLATDLYLPAVPALPDHLGGTLADSQMTLASFMGSLALSQLFWGWASDRFGEYRVLIAGMILLFGGSLCCALSGNMNLLIGARAVQGMGAGAATAVVPALLQRSFDETSAIRAISIVGMAESVVPALGPVIGAVLISLTHWRVSFWIISLMTAALVPFVSRVTGRLSNKTAHRESLSLSLQFLLKDTTFLRYAGGYAVMFGALIMFVASLPQIIAKSLHLPIQYFSVVQVLGVMSFILAASQGGKLAEAFGVVRLLRWGALLQTAAGTILLLLSTPATPPVYVISLAWCLFCAGLGFRGPALMARSLASVGPHSGQASGFMMFLSFGIASAATAAVAPFLVRGLFPLALGLLAMTLASVAMTAPVKAR